MLPEGMLLDLDDTILVYGGVTEQSWQSVCAQYGGKNGLPPSAEARKLQG